MHTLFRSLLVLGVSLAVCGVAVADDKEKAKALLGLWKRTTKINDKEVVIELEFLVDKDQNKLIVKMQGEKNETLIMGTWKLVSDDQLEMTMTLDGKSDTKRVPFTVSKTELKLTDPKGVVETYKREKK